MSRVRSAVSTAEREAEVDPDFWVCSGSSMVWLCRGQRSAHRDTVRPGNPHRESLRGSGERWRGDRPCASRRGSRPSSEPGAAPPHRRGQWLRIAAGAHRPTTHDMRRVSATKTDPHPTHPAPLGQHPDRPRPRTGLNGTSRSRVVGLRRRKSSTSSNGHGGRRRGSRADGAGPQGSGVIPETGGRARVMGPHVRGGSAHAALIREARTGCRHAARR
jgi:hypothetical protein